MPIENQELDGPSLAILYGKTLFQIDTPEKKAAPIPVQAQENSTAPVSQSAAPLSAPAGVLIIVRDKLINGSTTHTMFTNLLNACNLSLAQVDLISPYTLDISAYDLLKKYSPAQIIMFGVASSEIGLSVYFPDYQVQDVDGIHYLTAPDLALIENNPDLKKKLWQSLKKLFSL